MDGPSCCATVCTGMTSRLGEGIEETGMEISTFSILGLGFALGLKHALEADHVVAVSTIVSERRSLIGSSLVGAL